MVFIRYNTREILFNIVYYGSQSCRKLTSLQAIYQSTSESYRGEWIGSFLGEEPLYEFEYSPLAVEEIESPQMTLKVKGNLRCLEETKPNLKARKMLLQGVDGVVFVASSEKEEWEANLESWHSLYGVLWKYFRTEIASVPVVIQFDGHGSNEKEHQKEFHHHLLSFSREKSHLHVDDYERLPFIPTTAQENQGVFNPLEQCLLLAIKSFKSLHLK